MGAKEEILSKLKRIKPQLAQKYPISSMAIFGSFSRGKQVDDSDIDIMVELNGKIGSKFIDLAEELESTLGRRVDLISKNGIKPRYFNSIKNDLTYV